MATRRAPPAARSAERPPEAVFGVGYLLLSRSEVVEVLHAEPSVALGIRASFSVSEIY